MDISIYPKMALLAKWDKDRKWYETKDGEPPKCLRCGRLLPLKHSLCALSRYIDVSICPDCGTEEALLDWEGKALPLWKWQAVLHGEVPTVPGGNDVTLMPTCGFSDVFEQPRRPMWGHPNGFPVSELCYARADYNGYRWYSAWTDCMEKPKDASLIEEVDAFYNALLALPEFHDLHTLCKLCKSYAEKVSENDPSNYNLYAETPHFHIWLRLITRERDYNLYCHFFIREQRSEAEEAEYTLSKNT